MTTTSTLTPLEQDCRMILELGNQFKTIGHYELANTIFLALVRAREDIWEALEVSIETSDPEGWDREEAYYDLIVVGSQGQYLNCPVPVLDDIGVTAEEVVTLMKAAAYVDRKVHARKRRKPERGELIELITIGKRLIPVITEDTSVMTQFDEAAEAALSEVEN